MIKEESGNTTLKTIKEAGMDTCPDLQELLSKNRSVTQ